MDGRVHLATSGVPRVNDDPATPGLARGRAGRCISGARREAASVVEVAGRDMLGDRIIATYPRW
jgi:hypothetical protein